MHQDGIIGHRYLLIDIRNTRAILPVVLKAENDLCMLRMQYTKAVSVCSIIIL